jgi:hypothetical protein
VQQQWWQRQHSACSNGASSDSGNMMQLQQAAATIYYMTHISRLLDIRHAAVFQVCCRQYQSLIARQLRAKPANANL